MTDFQVFNYSKSLLNLQDTRIMIDVIGYIGGGTTACIMIPQVYKAYKSKKTKNISGKFLIIQLIATVINIIYAFLENLLPSNRYSSSHWFSQQFL